MVNIPVLHIEGLKKTYQGLGHDVLAGLNLMIKQGEIYGLLGPNGAGKTTTVNIISGLLKYDSGKITVLGKDLISLKKTIMSRIGIVPQRIALYQDLTAYENLMIFGTIYGIPRKVLRNRIDELLSIFGLKEHKNRKVVSFSKGMKRRMNVLVGILHCPEFLILDEPTVGIDVQSKVVIIEYMKQLNAKGTTILYTSHDMDEAEHFCTRIGIIDGGKLITEDSPESLILSHRDCKDLGMVYIALTGKKLRNQ